MDYFNLESKRLKYRKLSKEDISVWMEFFINNDRLKYLGLDLQKSEKTLAEDWINTQLYRYEYQGLGHLAAELISDGSFVGMGGILTRDLNGKKEYEIAYSLLPKFWGNGYATEIALTMKEFAFHNLDSNRFISIIEIDNLESAKVAIKNGMVVLFQTEFLGMKVNVYGINNIATSS